MEYIPCPPSHASLWYTHPMISRKQYTIGLISLGATLFVGGLFIFSTIYAIASGPVTLAGNIGLSTIAYQPWLTWLLCIFGAAFSVTGYVLFVSYSSRRRSN